jgi:hypothetical protein
VQGNEIDIKVRLDWQAPAKAIASLADWVDLMNIMFDALISDGYEVDGTTYRTKNVRITHMDGPGDSPWSKDNDQWFSFKLFATVDLDGEMAYA